MNNNSEETPSFKHFTSVLKCLELAYDITTKPPFNFTWIESRHNLHLLLHDKINSKVIAHRNNCFTATTDHNIILSYLDTGLYFYMEIDTVAPNFLKNQNDDFRRFAKTYDLKTFFSNIFCRVRYNGIYSADKPLLPKIKAMLTLAAADYRQIYELETLFKEGKYSEILDVAMRLGHPKEKIINYKILLGIPIKDEEATDDLLSGLV